MPFRYLWFICVVASFGCQTSPSKNPLPASEVELVTTLKQLVPAFADMDSISISLYKNPFTDDKEMYTRFYTQLNTTDSSVIAIVKNTLGQNFQKQDTLRVCRSEGKIHCFDKGKIFQTIFFASQPAGCSHAYIIREGFYYYVPLDSAWASAIPAWKQNAAEVE
jgi:hypothetical protein